MELGQELLNVPMGQMIQSMAMAIAQGQAALDRSSMRTAELMSGQMLLRDEVGRPISDKNGKPTVIDSRVYFGYTYDVDKNNQPRRTPLQVSMMELGFTPNFYQFIDTIIEVKISITITQANDNTTTSSSKTDAKKDSSQPSWWAERTNTSVVSTTQVNATYASKYNYSAEGASLLRTKLVPIPPPAILEERIREVMSMERSYETWNLLKTQKDQLLREMAAIPGDQKDASAAKQLEIDEVNTRMQTMIDAFGPTSAKA